MAVGPSRQLPGSQRPLVDGPVVLVKMLTEDWPKKGGNFPGKAQRSMGEMFRIEDNLRSGFRYRRFIKDMLTGQIGMRGREIGQRRGEDQARFLIQGKSLQGWLQPGPTAKLCSVCFKTLRLGSHSPSPGTHWALAAPWGVNFLALPTSTNKPQELEGSPLKKRRS